MKSFGFLVVGFACAAITWGQAVAESAVGTGAASGAAAGAKGAGQGVGAVFGALSKTLDQGSKPGAPATATSSNGSATSVGAATPRKVASVVIKPIDPSQVTVGMDRNEVLARFGEHSTRTTQIRRSQMLDTFWYPTIAKDELIVRLTDGKVSSAVLASQRNRVAVRK